MPLLPVKLPQGIYKNGTPYTRKARWSDGSLVRWHDGSLRPIGGWLRRNEASSNTNIDALVSDPTAEAVRDIFSWRDNDLDQNTVFGTNLAVYYMDPLGAITDITPGAYTPNNSSKDADTSAGYGQNPYGAGAYGTANNLVGVDAIPPDRWYFDNFGEVLLFGSRNNGDLFELDLATLNTSVVSNAPTQLQAMVVTDQRQVLTLGGDGEPRRVQASEVEDRTLWTAATDNQVVDRIIPGTGRLLNAVNVLRQTLILAENDAHVARYIGPPYVLSIDLAGDNCGPLAPEAVSVTDRFAVWWGERNFWLYDGSIQVLPCDVIDFLYKDLEAGQVSKICSFTNTDFSEIWWLYQSTSTTTTEVDSYVAWDYRNNHWTTGRLDRTCGTDKGVLLDPIMVNSSGEIYNHELPDVFPMDEGDVFAETGALELGNGDKNMAVRYIYPDHNASGDVTYELIARQFPNDTEYTYGPYTQNDPTPTRALGRAVKLKVNFQQANAEHGHVRLDYAPVGTGKR